MGRSRLKSGARVHHSRRDIVRDVRSERHRTCARRGVPVCGRSLGPKSIRFVWELDREVRSDHDVVEGRRVGADIGHYEDISLGLLDSCVSPVVSCQRASIKTRAFQIVCRRSFEHRLEASERQALRRRLEADYGCMRLRKR